MNIFIIIIVILALVTVFSVQNAAPVAISFFFWKFESSLAIVVFLSVLTGIVMGSMAAFFFKASKNKERSKNNMKETKKEKSDII